MKKLYLIIIIFIVMFGFRLETVSAVDISGTWAVIANSTTWNNANNVCRSSWGSSFRLPTKLELSAYMESELLGLPWSGDPTCSGGVCVNTTYLNYEEYSSTHAWTTSFSYNGQSVSFGNQIKTDTAYHKVICYSPYITQVFGCMDQNALNYNPASTVDDGSCRYDIPTHNSYLTSFSLATSTGIVTVTGFISSSDAPVRMTFLISDDVTGRLYTETLTNLSASSTFSHTFPTIMPSVGASEINYYVDFNKDKLIDFITGWQEVTLDFKRIHYTIDEYGDIGIPPDLPSTDYIPKPCSITNLGGCFENALHNAFVPDESEMKVFIQKLKNGFITKFPVGYFYILYDSLLEPAGSLTVINATIPNGVIGAGSTIHLDLDGVLDPILNAKASDSGFGSSTATLYEITAPYWNFFVYLMLGVYILSRLLGSKLINRKLIQ